LSARQGIERSTGDDLEETLSDTDFLPASVDEGAGLAGIAAQIQKPTPCGRSGQEIVQDLPHVALPLVDVVGGCEDGVNLS